MKAADVPDEAVLSIVREYNEGRAPDRRFWHGAGDVTVRPPDYTVTGPRWACTWDVQERLADVPERVLAAKLRRLVKRGLLEGCACGCRGDFFIPGL